MSTVRGSRSKTVDTEVDRYKPIGRTVETERNLWRSVRRTLVLRRFTDVTSFIFLNLSPRRSEAEPHWQPVVEVETAALRLNANAMVNRVNRRRLRVPRSPALYLLDTSDLPPRKW